MSLRQNDPTPTAGASIREFDLSVDRSQPDDFEFIRTANARAIAIVNVSDEAYLRFGAKEAPQIDLRDFDGSTFTRPTGNDDPLGAIYLENPAGSGTLEIFFGQEVETAPTVTIDEIDTINNLNDTVDVSDRQGREIGKTRLMDSGGVLIDSGNRLPVDSAQSNQTGVVGDTITPGGTATAFASQNVPAGFSVVVQNDPANSDNVQLADNGGIARHVLVPGASFSVAVQNLDEISVIGSANNPTVHATVEAP